MQNEHPSTFTAAADIHPPPPNAQPQTPQRERTSAFPDQLLERPPKKAQRSGLRDCLTWRFLRSYSFRGARDARTKWRKTAMILTLLAAFGTMVLGIVAGWRSIGEIFAFAIVDVFFFWALAWSLAVIGDAVGSRKVLGIQWNRNVLDAVIWVSLLLYVAFILIWIFSVGQALWQAFWLPLTAAIIGVAWIASEPTYQGF